MKWNFWKKTNESKQRRLTNIRPAYTAATSYNTLMPDNSNVASKDIYWRIYKNEAPVRGAINVTVNAICSTGFTIRTYKQGDVDMEDPRVAKITEWLQYPDQPIPYPQVIESIAINLKVFHNAFVEIVPNAGNSLGWMYPLDTRDCELLYNEAGTQIVGLQHQVLSGNSTRGARLVVLKPDQFVHISLNAGGAVAGLASIESIVKDIDLYNQTVNYANKLFTENGVPAMHINMEDPSPSDYEVMERNVANLAQGKTFLTVGKVSVDPIGGKVNEISYDKIMNLTYQAVMTVFQVPPSLMCYPGESTSESSREQTNSFAMNIQAHQRIIDNGINRCILKIWGEDYADIRHELNPWINEKAQAAIDEIGVQNGYLTPNMILKRRGLPTVPWGDYPYSVNFIPQLIGEKPWDEAENNQVSQGGQKPSQGKRDGQSAETPRPRRQGTGQESKAMLEEIHQTNLILMDYIKRDLALREDIQKRAGEYFAQ